MYEKYPYICIASLIVSIAFTCFSPREALNVNMPLVSARESQVPKKEAKQAFYESLLSWTGKSWNESNKTKANSWNSTSTRQLQSVHDNPSCNAECKVKTLVKLGIWKHIAEPLVSECKKTAQDPVNCIKIWSFLVANESSWGKNCYSNNCYGVKYKGKLKSYSSYAEWVKDWVSRYNRFWFNQRNPSSFYSNSPSWNPKTHYCMSEIQPNGTLLEYCPNGYKNAWSFFNKLAWFLT